MELSGKSFQNFSDFIYTKTGICMDKGKESLVTSRIGKRMRKLEMNSFDDYLKFIKEERNENEMVEMIDAISTNITHFFRESEHFDYASKVFSKWLDRGQKKFRFWSAASSTGEEPYSLAMTLAEVMHGESADIKILATDISTRVLSLAKNGVYEKSRVAAIPKEYKKYFSSTPDKEQIQVTDEIRNRVTFSRINLSSPPFPMRGPFDMVFCRNVMIYFDNTVRTRLINDIYRLLKPGGIFFVGHSESLSSINHQFKYLKPAVYFKG